MDLHALPRWLPAALLSVVVFSLGATPIQSRLDRLTAQMTDAERLRAGLFPEFEQRQPFIESDAGSLLSVSPLVSGRLPSTPDAVRELACNADAVLAGTVTSAVSHPTNGGGFIFTDYTFDLSAVLLDQHGEATTGAVVTVSRPGGTVTVDGVEFVVRHDSFPPLIPGGRYLVFGSYVPEAAAYLAKQPASVYQCADGTCTRSGLPGRVPEARLLTLALSAARGCGVSRR